MGRGYVSDGSYPYRQAVGRHRAVRGGTRGGRKTGGKPGARNSVHPKPRGIPTKCRYTTAVMGGRERGPGGTYCYTEDRSRVVRGREDRRSEAPSRSDGKNGRGGRRRLTMSGSTVGGGGDGWLDRGEKPPCLETEKPVRESTPVLAAVENATAKKKKLTRFFSPEKRTRGRRS